MGPSGWTPAPPPHTGTGTALLPHASLGCDATAPVWGSRPSDPCPELRGSGCPLRGQSQVVLQAGGRGLEAEKRARRPVDMFRRNSSRGTGAGRGPGLSHSCWVYPRGIVLRQEGPAARGWALGCCTTGSRLPDPLLSQGPCQLHFPSSWPISPEVTPALSWQCRAEAWRQTKRSRGMGGIA